MNAYIAFRTNGAGTYNPTQEERTKSAKEVWSSAFPRSYRKSLEKSDTTTSATDTTSGTTQALGQDAFLQLLVTQMQYQDPMDPMNNEDMLAQLAQFSSLEQMNNLNTNFENLAEVMWQQSLMTASSLLGQQISAVTTDGVEIDGVVDRVSVSGSTVYLNVGDQVVTVDQITDITTGE